MKSPRTFLIVASKINRGLGSQRPSRKKTGTLRLCGERLIKGLCNNTKSRAQRSYKFSNGWESLQEQNQWEVAKTQRKRESCVVRATWRTWEIQLRAAASPQQPHRRELGEQISQTLSPSSLQSPVHCPNSARSQRIKKPVHPVNTRQPPGAQYKMEMGGHWAWGRGGRENQRCATQL